MGKEFLVLKCQACGAKLYIYPDMDSFCCGYCGTEMQVVRRGGAVSLKAVEDAIERVQKGTDKTAAELAIKRYEAELAELRPQVDKAAGQPCLFLGCAGLCFVLALLVLNIGANKLGIFILLFALLFGLGSAFAQDSDELTLKRKRLKELERLITEKKALADS